MSEFPIKNRVLENHPVLADKIKTLYQFKDIAWIGQLGGLSAVNCEIIADGHPLVLKQHRSMCLEKIEKIQQITTFLKSNGLPVAAALSTINGCPFFILENHIYTLFPKIEGIVLHEPSMNTSILEEVALLLATFHQLNPFSLDLFTNCIKTREKVEEDAQDLLKTIVQFPIERDIDTFTKKLVHTKLDFLQEFFPGDLFDPYMISSHLVHGDFYNENLLFNAKQKITLLLDFEETHVGHRIEDVIHFIFLACCNTGFTDENLKKANNFLQVYNTYYPLQKDEIAFGIFYELYKQFSSFFLEKELYRTRNLFFSKLLERDWKKIVYFRTHLGDFLKNLC